jgi:hypothetical protein
MLQSVFQRQATRRRRFTSLGRSQNKNLGEIQFRRDWVFDVWRWISEEQQAVLYGLEVENVLSQRYGESSNALSRQKLIRRQLHWTIFPSMRYDDGRTYPNVLSRR